jgi:LAS superfamily LD-carboxypeptidase LdcB
MAVGLSLLAGGLHAPAQAAPQLPRFTGLEFKSFYYASLPLPGTQRITSRPSIYGDPEADLHIQHLAEQRGYRLQVTPTVSLGSYGGLTLAADAGNAWVALLDASRRHGTPLQGNSGYRSVTDQRAIFRRHLGGYSTSQIESGAADDAIEAVLSYHSIPGYSRHHTGKTIDMSAAGGSNGSFSSSAAYQWLAGDNYATAKSFGFIPNYPPGAGAQGPNPEPWEFVYVGVAAIRCAVLKVPLADPEAWRICGLPDRPVVGELTGDGIDDVLVYRVGTRAEGFFPGTASRSQTATSTPNVNGVYQPLIGDFRGDGVAEVLWYAPGPGQDFEWSYTSTGGGPSTRAVTINGRYQPLVGDFNGDGRDDIFWYAPGSAADWMWLYRADGTYENKPRTVNGAYRPAAGDFNGDGRDDIFWYAPGSAADFIWLHRAGQPPRTVPAQVAGSYAPVAGDFDANGSDDVFWYAAGPPADFVWYQDGTAAHESRGETVNGTYALGTGDHDGDGADDIAFLAPPGGSDWVWFGNGRQFDKAPRDW